MGKLANLSRQELDEMADAHERDQLRQESRVRRKAKGHGYRLKKIRHAEDRYTLIHSDFNCNMPFYTDVPLCDIIDFLFGNGETEAA